jgi:hypothetical protein
MAALLQQLNPPGASAASETALADCIVQLRESAAVFTGVALNDIPACLVVTNYIAEIGDRAQQCLKVAAAMQRDGNTADSAECFGVVSVVEGLLQLAVQPVVMQLFGMQKTQELVGGLMSCKQQLVNTLARMRQTS